MNKKVVKNAEKAEETKKAEETESIDVGSTKSHMSEVGVGSLSVELPCGYLDDDGKLHDTAIVQEMTGEEEDILAGSGSVVPRLNQVIVNCCVSFGIITDRRMIAKAVEELTAVDRMMILIAIRRISLGDFYDVRVKCPEDECGAISSFPIDLRELDIKKMYDPHKRLHETELPRAKKDVRWHVMNGKDEEWLTKTQKKNKTDRMTLAMLARVDKIGDEVLVREPKREFHKSLKMLKKLGTSDRNFLRDFFEKHEGKIDDKIEFCCPECDREWEDTLDTGQKAFFFPSQGQ